MHMITSEPKFMNTCDQESNKHWHLLGVPTEDVYLWCLSSLHLLVINRRVWKLGSGFKSEVYPYLSIACLFFIHVFSLFCMGTARCPPLFSYTLIRSVVWSLTLGQVYLLPSVVFLLSIVLARYWVFIKRSPLTIFNTIRKFDKNSTQN